jgi:Secretion system C-terminal sorting domain
MHEACRLHRPTTMFRLYVIAALLFCFLILVGTADAELFRVPEDYTTIQNAIDAAPGVPGDTILVGPDRHVENLHIYGKELVLASHYVLDNDPETIMATVIDGYAMAGADSASTILWVNVPGTSSEIRGFTIVGGDGTNVNDSGSHYREGGGLCVWSQDVQDGHLTIHDNVFRDNSVLRQDGPGATPVGGGGMAIWWTDITLERNVFYNNYAYQYSGAYAMNRNASTVRNNLFSNTRLGINTYRGTICYYWYATSADPVENNTIVESSVESGTNTLFLSWQTGTGVEFQNNVFTDSATIYSNVSGPAGTFSYNLSLNLLDGEGNIAGVPIFDDYVTYVLNDISDGVDDGSPGRMDVEDLGNPGMALWPAKGTTDCDMGVYGGPGMPLGGFPDFTTELTVSEHGLQTPPRSFSLAQPYPNPFNAAANFTVSMPETGLLTVDVYNIQGQRVTTFVEGAIRAGTHVFSLDSTGLSSGQYFIRAAKPGEPMVVRKVTLLQ